jgi:hypothetical protein
VIKLCIKDHVGVTQDLNAIAAAITMQVQRDFAQSPPLGYGITATVRFDATSAKPHADEWVIGLFATADQPGALGYHDQSKTGVPLIKVFPLLDDPANLSITISHEVLEVLADPNCARAAQSRDGRFWAYEVCDAVEQDSYDIAGVKVSNFVLPPYFEPDASKHYDHMGLVKHALEIRPGGYGQWYDATRGWQQVLHQSVAPRAYRQLLRGRTDRRG